MQCVRHLYRELIFIQQSLSTRWCLPSPQQHACIMQHAKQTKQIWQANFISSIFGTKDIKVTTFKGLKLDLTSKLLFKYTLQL